MTAVNTMKKYIDDVDDVDEVYASSEMCEDDVKSAEKLLTGELQGSSRAL